VPFVANKVPEVQNCAASGDTLSVANDTAGRYTQDIMNVDYRNILTLESGKRGGKPCIRGMRITVYDVLSYLAAGMTREEILADFPYLTDEDILACLAYVADHE
jgi:uncharacterized protein (DUF433 family)